MTQTFFNKDKFEQRIPFVIKGNPKSNFTFHQKEVRELSMSEKIERAREFLRELDKITDRNIIAKARRMMSIQEAIARMKRLEIEF